jgi:hypothetical protein
MVKLLDNPELGELVFLVEEKPLYSCRALLSVRSSYMRELLAGGDCNNPVIVTDCSYIGFRTVLEYLTTDTVTLNETLAMELFGLSERFGLQRLKWLCQDYLHKNVNVNNVLRILIAAHNHSAVQLKRYCLGFIRNNLKEVKKENTFNELVNYPSVLLEVARM